MKVRENHEIIIDKYPFAGRLNSRLLSDAEGIDYPLSFKTNVKGKMSNWSMESDNLDTLKGWITSLVKAKHNFKGLATLRFVDTWYARYDKNDHTLEHDHNLSWLSFVYFVKCPRGSSPLIFTTSRKKGKAEEGKVVNYPSWIRHSVPKNRCEDRVVVAGNIILRSL